jgi:acyl-CoA dehydrogenase
MDHARRDPDAGARAKHQAFVDLMIPIVKGWCTEIAQDVAYLGIQVHGGMGFIEETGAAQYYRDARIITIYEGTTGIQANDLIGRKTARDAGMAARAVASDIDGIAARCASHTDPSLRRIGLSLANATAGLQSAIEWMVPAVGTSPRAAHAAAVTYLELWGLVAGGWQMARAALVAVQRIGEGAVDDGFMQAKLATALFYAECLLPQADGLARTIVGGSDAALALKAEQFERG